VRETVEDLRFTVPERNIQLEDMPQEAHVLVDAGRISQVIANFLSNALKYSPSEKPITVGVTEGDQEARVWVRDEGPGLSPQDQQRVWQRYFQGEGAHNRDVKSVNLGLGLHLCRLLIEQHHGRIGVESQVGQGSTFWFTLPLHAVHS
jgi:signal transduction histidine kinase